MYKISREKFEFDINSIIELEKLWVGHEVLAYNHYTSNYEWGVITRRILNSRQFEIEWPDQKSSIHCAYFLFISKTKNFENFTSKKKVKNFIDESNYNRYSFTMTENSQVNQQLINNNKNIVSFKNHFQIDKDRSTPIIDANENVGFSILDKN